MWTNRKYFHFMLLDILPNKKVKFCKCCMSSIYIISINQDINFLMQNIFLMFNHIELSILKIS